MKQLSLFFVVLIVIFEINTAQGQNTYYVKSTALTTGSGLNWDNPMQLPEALQIADNNDTIHVAAGTYYPKYDEFYADTTGQSYRATFAFKPGITLYGGYPATATGTDLSNRTQFSATILSGDLVGDDGAGFTNRTDNVIHVVFINTSADSAQSTIDGVMVRGGNGRYLGPLNLIQPSVQTPDSFIALAGTGLFVPRTYHGLHGAGILVLNNNNQSQGYVNIRNCIITDNQANQGANNSGNGHAQARGAGIGVENNLQEGANIAVTITNTSVTSNRTVDSLIGSTATDYASSVAGIFIMGGSISDSAKCRLIMDSCVVSNNIHACSGTSTKTRSGAGIRFSSKRTDNTISHSVFSNNTINCAGNGNGYGAGIDLFAPLTMNSCEVFNNSIITNTGYAVGSGIQIGIHSLGLNEFINTTIHGNIISCPANDGYGAGIYTFSDLLIKNSTLSGNQITALSPLGSAIGAHTGTISITNTTVANNTGSEAINYEMMATGSSLNLDNTLFTSNTSTVGVMKDIVFAGTGTITRNYMYSIADSLYYKTSLTDTTRIAARPKIAPLAYNGGFGQTHLLLNMCDTINTAIGNGNPVYRAVADQDLINRFNTPWNPSIGATEFPLRADTLPQGICGQLLQWNTASLFNNTLTFSIADTTIASITQTGVIMPLKGGQTKVQVIDGTDVYCTPITVVKQNQIINGFDITQPPCISYGTLITLQDTTSAGLQATYQIIAGTGSVATLYSPNEVKIMASGLLVVEGSNAGNNCYNPVDTNASSPISVEVELDETPVLHCNSDLVTVSLNPSTSNSTSYTYSVFNMVPASAPINIVSPDITETITLPIGTTQASFMVTDDIGGCAVNADNIVCITPLGVNWVNFQGRPVNGNHELNWEVVSEKGVAYYEVQYSNDGALFSNIGRVPFATTTNITNHYKFVHYQPIATHCFYRIRQVAFDGSFSFSGIVSIFPEKDTPILRLYPNPVKDRLVFMLPKLQEGKLTISLDNFLGNNIWIHSYEISNQQNLIEDLSALPSGNYFVRAQYQTSEKEITATWKVIKIE
jgi:hypothetical protein